MALILTRKNVEASVGVDIYKILDAFEKGGLIEEIEKKVNIPVGVLLIWE